MYDTLTGNWTLSDEMERLQKEKKAAIELQSRKHEDWNDNYELYRNKVKTNRLTQRQAVNIPLMKETIKTNLSKIDDPPNVDWKELGGDEVRELIYQEVWNQSGIDNNFEIVDIIDKKNVLLYGLSTRKLNIADDGISVDVLDVYDIAYDPLMKAWDVDSARFFVHQNIFKPVRDILANEDYTKEGKDNLKMWVDSPPGITQGQVAKEEWEKKMERLKSMGIDQSDFGYFAGGERLVNLTEHYTTRWNPTKKEFEKRVVTYADDMIELRDVSLDEALGVDFWPVIMWSEDPETNDVYPDAIADLVRTPNKVINVWYSQLIENRTLKNFQMHWYSPSEGYTPQTYTPGPGMMLPAPPGDDISKVIKPVEITGLDDTLDAISILTNIVERGSGATAIDKGQGEQGSQTLGEVQVLVGKANERATAMTKFYRRASYELAYKWDKLMHANAPKFIKLYKESASGKIYPKTVFAGDWKSEIGYKPIVRSTSEQETEGIKNIQKWMFITQQFPNNPVVRQISQKRMLESVDATPEELRQVEEAEQKLQEQAEAQAAMAMQSGMPQPSPEAPAVTPAGVPTPEVPTPDTSTAPNQDMAEIGSLLQELNA
jgi:hypothetical protein